MIFAQTTDFKFNVKWRGGYADQQCKVSIIIHMK